MTETAELDAKDRRILWELELDARRNNAEIGKRVGLSREVVAYRINRLMQEGVIEYFQTVINVGKLGYVNFRVYLRLEDITAGEEEELRDYLGKHPKVWWIALAEGRWDIDFAFWARGVYEFYEFWNEFMGGYKRFLQERQISIYTYLVHFRRSFLLGKKHRDMTEAASVGGKEAADADELDLKILRILGPNGRMPTIEIAKKVKSSPKVIAYRIKRLEREGVILGYKPMLNLKRIGYEYYKIDVRLRDTKVLKKAEAWAASNPNVVYIDRTIGGTDFEFDVNVRSPKELDELMQEFRNLLGEAIRDTEYFRVITELKIIYMPER
jgi:DNA-binding Lrp family transcriptional regulator